MRWSLREETRESYSQVGGQQNSGKGAPAPRTSPEATSLLGQALPGIWLTRV